VPIVEEDAWAPGPIWTGAEYLAPTGTRARTFHPVTSRYTDYAAPARDNDDDYDYINNNTQFNSLLLTCLAQLL
jgi:hypothetical protein